MLISLSLNKEIKVTVPNKEATANYELISPSPQSHATISEHKDHTHTHPTYEQAIRAHITDTKVRYYMAVTSHDATTLGKAYVTRTTALTANYHI
jgi:hypothetical protein